jgi:hypothetical protein
MSVRHGSLLAEAPSYTAALQKSGGKIDSETVALGASLKVQGAFVGKSASLPFQIVLITESHPLVTFENAAVVFGAQPFRAASLIVHTGISESNATFCCEATALATAFTLTQSTGAWRDR